MSPDLNMGVMRAIFSLSGKTHFFNERSNICFVDTINASMTNLTTSGLMSSKPGLLFEISLENASFSSLTVRGFLFKVGKLPERKL